MRRSKEITAIFLAGLVVLARGLPAGAQTIPGAADITRLQNSFENGDRTPQKPAEAAPMAAQKSALPQEEAVPENAQSLAFTLNDIMLDGATVYNKGELAALWKKDVGRTITLKEVYDVAAAITAKYRADGYFLSSAYVPAQKIQGGIAHITVVEGYIQDVEITGKVPNSWLLKQMHDRLLALGPLNIKMLERQMLVLNDLPGTHFRAVLKAMPGTAAAAASSASDNQTVVIPATRDDPASAAATKAAALTPDGAIVQLGHRDGAAPADVAAAPPVSPAPVSLAPETMSLDVAAHVSSSAPVVFFSPRDNPQGALASKISAAGGNAQNAQVLELGHPQNAGGSTSEDSSLGVSLGQNVEQLGTKLEQIGNVELVVVDPIGAWSGAAHPTDEDIRSALAPIAQTATAHKVSALVVAQSLSGENWLTAAAPAAPRAAPPVSLPPPVKEGGVLLEISASPAPAVHGYVSLDNTGSRFIGPWMAGAQLSIDRGLPDFQQALITLNGSVPDHDLKSALGKYIIPLSSNGVKLALNAGYTEGRPGFTLAPDNLVADSFTAGAEIDWDLVRQRAENVRLLAGLDYLNSSTTLLAEPFQHDRISTARLGAHFDEQDRFNGSVILDATVKKGLEILGASHAGDPDLSRADGRPDFTSLAATIYRYQNINANWNALVGFTGQVADAPLLSSQQFGYGGQSFGRAYDSSEFVGDQGLAAMMELRYDGLHLKHDYHLQPFGFYDIGRIWNRGLGLPSTDTGASAGIGLRLTSPKGVTSSLTVAEPLTSRISDQPPYSDGKSPRFLVSVGAPIN